MKFQQIQQQFMDHIQDPEHNAAPADIEDRRLAIYRELFFNNVVGFVSTGFPVLRSLYSEAEWHRLVRQFYAGYSCHSPYFLHIAEHFLQFIQQQYQLTDSDPIFMLELAHYEWSELYLATLQDSQQDDLAAIPLASAAVLTAPLQLSTLCLLLAYPYPVHQISQVFQPTAASENQFYLLYRNAQDEVKFMLINQLTALLLQQLQQTPGITANSLFLQLQPQVPQFSQQQFQQGASTILQQFASKGVIQAFQMG
ncbi:HvfC family RiPP maturation protein [Rheinheimera salexigens]|uniref:DUF2063 domain-containing protein n=1 Tax=Rheinheimera salexigens TaxID=1628148 RepID=A0A1E7Q914_9GAMM|nr:putative DNA-binding domain-containing protein [Rheinheimera salexigens]OEY70543.1 DUF2063 domain-containing protein [Rheinheimera salexigens]